MATTSTTDARSLQGPGFPDTTAREERLHAAHQLIIDGVNQLTTSDTWTRMLTTAARFPTYSFGNLLLIEAQMATASKVAGLRFWNSIGRTVNRGERGIRILAPIIAKRTNETDNTADSNERRVVGYRVIPVWDISQTTGEDLEPIRPHLLQGAAPDGLIEAICAQIISHAFTVKFGDCRPANGITNWATNTVTIRNDIEPLAQAKTGLHELAHVRIHRPLNGEPMTCRGIKEVEAESVAFIVANTLGIDTSTYSFPYIAHWRTQVTDPAVIQATAETVIRHARAILTELDQT